jgi:prepilin-type processing-associated H-X9-DG protein
MSKSLNGYPDYDPWVVTNIPMFKKLTEIEEPNTDKCMVFIDEHEYSLTDSIFGMPTRYSESQQGNPTPMWWDMPANRHSQGANLSFADSHVEHWKWAVPKIHVGPIGQPQAVPSAEMPDWLRLRACIKQRP